MRGAACGDGVEVAGYGRASLRCVQQPADSAVGLAGALRLFVEQAVEAGAGMGVERVACLLQEDMQVLDPETLAPVPIAANRPAWSALGT